MADKVIAPGDDLFGSKVVTAYGTFGGRYINDRGQIAFTYTLENGIQGVAVATPATTGSTSSKPAIAANGVVNGASYQASAISPGTIASLFGANLSPTLASGATSPLATTLEGVTVRINGTPAPIYFVSRGQINVQIPYELTGSSAQVVVSTAAGVSDTFTVPVAAASPGIFTAGATGSGEALAVFADTGALASGRGRHIRSGDVVVLYATGLGAVNPPIASGSNSCTASACAADLSNIVLRRTITQPELRIGGVAVPSDQILFSGLAPQFVGLYQINFIVPPGLPAGDAVPIVIIKDGVSSRDNVTVATQN